MTLALRVALAGALLIALAPPAGAQAPPPKVGPFVVDVRGLFVKFPDALAVADSRGLDTAQLPGAAFGGGLGLHVYLLKCKQVTFGIGGEVVGLRAHNVPPAGAPTSALPGATEKFLSASPQLSFNFGGSNGWSYISGGIGLSEWSIVPDGAEPQDADTARLKTINYGGGGRWFMKKHLAFSSDVRVYAINPGPPSASFPGSPRSSLTVIGAGISVK